MRLFSRAEVELGFPGRDEAFPVSVLFFRFVVVEMFKKTFCTLSDVTLVSTETCERRRFPNVSSVCGSRRDAAAKICQFWGLFAFVTI